MHIWLVGMMGTGKTTVGGLVAERLERPLLDTDVMVMESSGTTITDLFAEDEQRFRALERAAVVAAAAEPPSVVATGGGVVLDARNVAAMQESGSIVLLTALPTVIADRVGSDDTDRPLARSQAVLERIAADRAAAYAAAADHTVDTTGKDATTVAEEVLACVVT